MGLSSWFAFQMVQKSHSDSSELDPALRSKAASVRSRLLRWFTANGRSFRWRRDASAYVVLVSEILLKKTTAPVVDRFLPKFLEKYPDIRTLSRARVRDLRNLLEPLGLSQQRANQLRSLASSIAVSPDGCIPCTQAGLLSLPGVGPYTANSVLCVARSHRLHLLLTRTSRGSCYASSASQQLGTSPGDVRSCGKSRQPSPGPELHPADE